MRKSGGHARQRGEACELGDCRRWGDGRIDRGIDFQTGTYKDRGPIRKDSQRLKVEPGENSCYKEMPEEEPQRRDLGDYCLKGEVAEI